MDSYDVVVIGGGIVGAAAGYHLARAGLRAAVVDRSDPGHATFAGAGIVCPVTATVGNADLVDLAFAAAAYYPALAAELAQSAGVGDGGASCGYESSAMLSVSVGGAGASHVARVAEWADSLARTTNVAALCGYDRLTEGEARALCPLLRSGVDSALLIPAAAQVNGHRFRESLLAAGRRMGLEVLHDDAQLLRGQANAVTGATIGGRSIHAGHVVVCAGAWTDGILRRTEADPPTVIPARGEILHLQIDGLDNRGWPLVEVEGSGPYIISWPEDRIAVGTTFEPAPDFDARPTLAGMCAIATSLQRAAGDQIKQAKLIECRVGLRPVSIDGLPIIGWGPEPDHTVLLATGHGANGLSWGPYTGKLIADVITGQPAEIDLEPFAPDRFNAAGRSADKEQS